MGDKAGTCLSKGLFSGFAKTVSSICVIIVVITNKLFLNILFENRLNS